MKHEIFVSNIKCNGCANTIKKELEKIGISNIEIGFTSDDSHKKRKVIFEGNGELGKNKLGELGYPEYGSEASKKLLKKLKSFVSCALGKF